MTRSLLVVVEKCVPVIVTACPIDPCVIDRDVMVGVVEAMTAKLGEFEDLLVAVFFTFTRPVTAQEGTVAVRMVVAALSTVALPVEHPVPVPANLT
jgi:hypothetical protein